MSNKPIRIQRSRAKGWRMPPNTVYVGRPSCWGNPFVAGRDGTAEECVRKYIDYLLPYRHHGPKNTLLNLHIGIMHLEGLRAELRGKNLACWCALGQPCHADFLLQEANE